MTAPFTPTRNESLVRSPVGHDTFPALDGLRALAVLAVVTTHAAFWTGRYELGWGNNLLARMDSGVAVFFVLSGFLLVRPWLRSSVDGAAAPSLRTYATRRIARIVPAYLIAVLLCFIVLPRNDDITSWDWLRHLTFTQIYHLGWQREGLTQTWSLCTEMAFYVVLPVVGAGLLRASRRVCRPTFLLGLLATGVLIPLPWYVFTHHSTAPWLVTSGYWLPGFIGWFAGGMMLAVVRAHLDSGGVSLGSRWRAAEALGRHPFTCWSLAALSYFIAMSAVAGPRSIVATTAGQAITKQTLYLIVAVALVWPAVFGRSKLTSAILGNRVMRYLGDISYGVFLYHLLVLDAVMGLLDNHVFSGAVLQVLPLTVLGAGLMAAVSFRYLERPIIRWAHSGSASTLVRPARHARSSRSTPRDGTADVTPSAGREDARES